mmetsp:Transcript_27204/g.76730  ORF Transcript_27204/g.76730 Transcript_27204/m.76730 type:complete len:104 (-) Transcript_27204:118-429(-)
MPEDTSEAWTEARGLPTAPAQTALCSRPGESNAARPTSRKPLREPDLLLSTQSLAGTREEWPLLLVVVEDKEALQQGPAAVQRQDSGMATRERLAAGLDAAAG